DPDRRSLVAAPRVERAGDLPLLVEDVAALLDPTREHHVAVDAEQILAVEAGLLDLSQRADWLCFTDRHRGRMLTTAPGDQTTVICRLQDASRISDDGTRARDPHRRWCCMRPRRRSLFDDARRSAAARLQPGD